MTVNDSKSCVSYLNKLVDEYNNTYHRSTNYGETNPNNHLNIKMVIESELPGTDIFSKGYTKYWEKAIFVIVEWIINELLFRKRVILETKLK